MTEAALVLAVTILTSFIKRWVYPKYGAIGTQVTAFVLALIGAIYYTYAQNIPGLKEVVTFAIGLFSISVAFYEVILQHIPIFKGPDVAVEG